MIPLKARYEGLQHSGCSGLPSFALWTILDPAGIPGHPFESTVADSTIRALGYDPYEPREETPP